VVKGFSQKIGLPTGMTVCSRAMLTKRVSVYSYPCYSYPWRFEGVRGRRAGDGGSLR
jgi:hypothetical protein